MLREPCKVVLLSATVLHVRDTDDCSLIGITYAPHKPHGSTDRLSSIGPELDLVVHPESVGGTPACRMIHGETEQLVLGPYVIDAKGNVRVIPPARMPGQL